MYWGDSKGKGYCKFARARFFPKIPWLVSPKSVQFTQTNTGLIQRGKYLQFTQTNTGCNQGGKYLQFTQTNTGLNQRGKYL